MNIHFILHETFEVPGAYLKWAQDRGHNITSTKVYEEEVLPETVEGIDFLIVMGGPQSPDEDRQAFPYYDPEAEIASRPDFGPAKAVGRSQTRPVGRVQ